MKRYIVALNLIMVMFLLVACGTSTPTPEQPIDQAVEEEAAEEVADEVAEEVATGPAVGGKVVINFEIEVDTLDISKTFSAMSILDYVGASLTALDPETMDVIPYLAKSWTVSDDGLVYEFTLRDDVMFHNGTPLTAEDYAWTIQRMIDPEIGSNCGFLAYSSVSEVEAVDEHTLRITLWAPNYYFLSTMAFGSCTMPMSKAYAEEVGEEGLGTNPVGVGPFRFVSWEPGVNVVLERNPDFAWGPSYTHGGPPYIETLDIRGIVDHTTRQAALEAGEIDLSEITSEDVERVLSTGQYQVLEFLPGSGADSVFMNVSKPPFDDIRVRQALNMAIDRDLIIKVMFAGDAKIMREILSPPTIGYCDEAADLGYSYNLEKAKELMAEAGYTPGEDGMLQKDGEPLVLVMPVYSWVEKLSILVQEQFKALGVQVELQQDEASVAYGHVMGGDFDIFLSGFLNEDASLMDWMFNSMGIGGYNFSQLSDPKMDELLTTMLSTTDPETNLRAACDVQVYAVEQAYTVPMFVAKLSTAVSNELKDVLWFRYSRYELMDAYFETE